jgi:hypothetical protein
MSNSSYFEINYLKLYERMGSTWLIDSVYMFIITPLGFIGGCLNLLSFFILLKINIKQTNLYKYLRFYSLNGSLFCFVCSLAFTSYSPRYYPYFLSYFSRIHRAFIFIIVSTSFYFIGNILDIIIAFDRLSIFVKALKKFTYYNAYLVCLVITILSFIINLPIYFSYYVKEDNEFYNDIRFNISTFIYLGRTDYFYSQLGVIITYIQVFIRDIITLFMEGLTSSLAFYCLKKFNKNQIELNIYPITTNGVRQPAIMIKKMNRDRQLLLLNLIQTAISFVSHIFICVSYIYSSQGVSSGLFNSLCIGYFSICFKHFSNIFIFYFLNSNFKKKFKILFKINQ